MGKYESNVNYDSVENGKTLHVWAGLVCLYKNRKENEVHLQYMVSRGPLEPHSIIWIYILYIYIYKIFAVICTTFISDQWAARKSLVHLKHINLHYQLLASKLSATLSASSF